MKKVILILLISALVIILFIQLWNSYQNFINPNNNKSISKHIKSIKYQEDILSEDPKIIYIHNFLSDKKELEHLISLGSQLKRPSTIDTKDNPAAILADVRTSQSAHLGKSRDEIVTALENRACEYVGLSTKYLEPMQVAVYEKGQKYNPHYDFFSGDSTEVTKGNRNKTVLLYLNDLPDDAGGNTFFPKLNLRIKPKAGDAIYFENMKDGEVDYNTMHAGEAIVGDNKKYAVNIWFREKPIY
jgi:prolyl 4-hydroxylase